MHITNIRSLDLNLLVSLKALLEEKHVSRAANKIGLSQPAMSRALARLRNILHDPLLVRGSSGLELSQRAEQLYPSLLTIFEELHQIITPSSADPSLMKGEIIIATRDNEMVTVLPKLMNTILKKAPLLTVRTIPFIGDDLSLLAQKKVDFIITGTNQERSNLCRSTLYKEDFVCLLSSKNPAIKNFTLETFIKMKHCLVNITGFGPGIVDTILWQKGLKREISIMVPHFLAAPHIIAGTNLVVTLPRRIGLLFAQQKNITLLEPPLKIPSFEIYLYWHTRHQNHPTHAWLRKVIRENSSTSSTQPR